MLTFLGLIKPLNPDPDQFSVKMKDPDSEEN